MSIQIVDILFLLITLIIILIGCELFVNGIEWLGVKLGLAENFVGSVLAAVGTALPETMIPIIAIIFATNGAGHEIAVGAIIGAPFMLATLAMLVGGITILVASRRGRRSNHLSISTEHFGKDIRYFLIMYSFAVLAALFLSGSGQMTHLGRYAIAILLIILYAIYIKRMLSRTSEKLSTPDCLHLFRPFSTLDGTSPKLFFVLIQVFSSLAIIIVGARLFVGEIELISSELGISGIVLAFLIAPVATELPEKFNSVIWYWRGRDTLALGNITGAMVFQSSIPVSIGLVFTDWYLDHIHIASMVFAMFAMALISIEMIHFKRISYKTLLFSGIFYFLYMVLVIYASSTGQI